MHFNPRARRKCTLLQIPKTVDKKPLQQSVIAPLQGLLSCADYALSVGVSDLSSTVLISHTAPCITLGNTTASRQ